MNFVFISPNFPETYYRWCAALKARGVNVLGVGDAPYHELRQELKDALTEYYAVSSLGDLKQMISALDHFRYRYGRLDFIESDNEWWLTQDATLRQWFDVRTGFWPADMEKIKAKSAMKKCFQQAGVKTARYCLFSTGGDKAPVYAFAKEVGYPLFAKPNIGVGAADSKSIHNDDELEEFLNRELPTQYIIEEYLEGEVVSFDGICDDDSNVVFCDHEHFPTPPADLVNLALDDYYYCCDFSIPLKGFDSKSFRKMGEATVKAFGIRKRFFHIEYFRLTKDKPGFAKRGEIVALECNMRPPGGYTPDLIDFACSVSVYDIYADVICFNQNFQKMDYEKYLSFSVSRRDGLKYAHSHDEIMEKYGADVCMHGRYPKSIADDLGDDYYFGRFKTYEEGKAFDEFIRKKA